jgi:hypothetical protein
MQGLDMVRRGQPHPEDLATALAHFNKTFRHRYRLPALTAAWLTETRAVEEAWRDLAAVRANGVRDASCAVLAKAALTRVPRYAIGRVDEDGRARVMAPTTADDEAYRGHHVLLVNPMGGDDNWSEVARWVRQVGGNVARRRWLAGLASERRPDRQAIDRMLRAAPEDSPAMILPGDEAFSQELAAEVAFIYDLEIETVRSWKRAYRRDLAGRKAGRPRNR